MRAKLAGTVAALVLVLTGCSTDTSAAYKECVQVLMLPTDMRDDVSTEEYADAVVDVAEVCTAAAEADPDAFVEAWTTQR